jgi:lysophospholipase L1-like esterase
VSRPIPAVALVLALLAVGAAPASAAGVRVMPLGDSITDGANVPGGYRIELWARLARDGAAVDFVGSRQNGPASLGDREHEGHSGWRIDELAGAVDDWLARHQPEIVLLLIGTNDILQDHAVAGAPARLGALLDRITARLPRARLLVTTLPPLGKPAWQEQVVAFNRALPGVVEARARAGKRVQLVDAARGMTAADLADGIHPNAGGYAKLAAAWHAALRPLLTPAAPR